MKKCLQQLGFIGSFLFIATVGEADELGAVLEAHFEPAASVEYLQYERVDHVHADQYGPMSYLVMDFATAQEDRLQQQVHAICSRVLNDEPLLRRLSHEGYDMISVSFDRQSQFDCL